MDRSPAEPNPLAPRPEPQRRGERAPWVVAAMVTLCVIAVAVGVPAYQRYVQEKRHRERIERLVASRGRVNEGWTEEEMAEALPRIVGALIEDSKGGTYVSSSIEHLDRLWAMGLLDDAQRTQVLERVCEVEIPGHAPVFPVAEEREIFVNTSGPWGIATAVGRAEGTLVVTVDGSEVARASYAGEVGPSEVGWSEQKHVDLRPATPRPGRYAVEARLTVVARGGEGGGGEATLIARTEVEVIEGDWRALVTLVDDATAQALVGRSFDLVFARWPFPPGDDPPPYERDLRIPHGASEVSFSTFEVVKEPLPFDINHRVRFEVDGQALPIHEMAYAKEGATEALPVERPSSSHGFTAKGIDLPPGRHALRIRLHPDPRSLAGNGVEARLYGGEIVLERVLIVEEGP